MFAFMRGFAFVGASATDGLLERELNSSIDAHDANQPKAEEPEPTSVTGTRRESPRNSAISVPAPIASTAFAGV